MKRFFECIKSNSSSERTSCRWVHLTIIAGITLLIYFNSLSSGFVADDNEFIKNNAGIRSIGNIPAFFVTTEHLASTVPEWGTHIYRPLRTVSYALDYALYGLNSTGYHMTNLILHILVCVTLYFLILDLFQNSLVSLAGSLIFAVHPVHVEAVSWIASRADLIAMLFLNVTLLCYARARKYPDKKTYLYLSLLSSLFAYLGKESAIVLPGILILYDYSLRNDRSLKNLFSSRVFRWMLFIMVAAGYLVLRFSVTGRMSQEMQWYGGTAYSNFLMMIKAAALYIWLLIYPFNLKTHYIIEPVTTIFDFHVVLSFAVILISAALIFYFHRKNRKIFFLLAWFYVGLLPVANIVPISLSMMAERFIYMPSAGPIVAMASGLYFIYQRGWVNTKILNLVFIILVLCLAVRVVTRNSIYESDLTFYTSSIESSPASAPSYLGLANLYYREKDYTRALLNYKKASKIDPNYAKALMGEALVLNKFGKKREALGRGERAVSLNPDDPSIRFNMGMLYKDSHDLRNALDQWKSAITLNPDYSEAYNNLGNYYVMMNDLSSAVAMYSEAVRSNPANAQPHYNLASIYERQGDLSAARHHFLLFAKLAGPEHRTLAASIREKYR